MAFPVRTVSLPAALRGQANGKLPASILVPTAGQGPSAPTVLLVGPAARAWRALTAAARSAGHVLRISGPASAYRTYAEQERIFRERFSRFPVSLTRRSWLGRWWWLKRGYALAAVPGTSNHGWALAVDTGEERDGDSGTENIDAATLSWLLANEQRFGFSHEVQSEPWHLRYFAGDSIPAAVLAYERGLAPPAPPKPPTGDDEMAVAVKGNESPRVYATDWIHKNHIPTADRFAQMKMSGLRTNNGAPFVVAQATIDGIPDAS